MKPLDRVNACLALAGAMVLAAGCGKGSPATDLNGKGSQGQVASPDPTYPPGPYGYEVNSTIADFKLYGRHNATLDGMLATNSNPMEDVWLSSYRKDYAAIVVAAAAEWCGPCNMEAPELQSMYLSYNQSGPKVAFLEALVQNNDGTPADPNTITRWAQKHGLTFDLAIDPSNVLTPYYDINAFPMGMVIRTKDMQIVWQQNGATPAQIKSAVDSVISAS